MAEQTQNSPNTRGRFITFEGGEGGGKTTQVQLLAKHLQSLGLEAVTTREPGGCPEAEAIRDLLFNTDGLSWQGTEEVMLNFAARHAHVRTLIEPALARGAWVICDRFADSTRAYQGDGQGIDKQVIETMAAIALDGLTPDRTLLLDLPVADGLARAQARAVGANRYESLDIAFHERVRSGFHAIAKAEPDRVRILDASASLESVAIAVLDALGDLLPPSAHGAL